MFIRVHAGCYISSCGNVKIRRRQQSAEVRGVLRQRWVWDVSTMRVTGEFQYEKTLRTLKVAKEFGRRFVIVPAWIL